MYLPETHVELLFPSQLVLLFTLRNLRSIWCLSVSVTSGLVPGLHAQYFSEARRRERDIHSVGPAHCLWWRKRTDSLVISFLDTIISDCLEVMVTKFLPRCDLGLLGAPQSGFCIRAKSVPWVQGSSSMQSLRLPLALKAPPLHVPSPGWGI